MISLEIEIAILLSYKFFYPDISSQEIADLTLEALREGLLFPSDQDLKEIDRIIKRSLTEALLSDVRLIRMRAELLCQKKK